MLVPVIRYHYSLFIVRLFIQLLLFHISSILCLLFKREKNNSDPELYSGISIPLTVHHHQYESINIIQQIPLTLS